MGSSNSKPAAAPGPSQADFDAEKRRREDLERTTAALTAELEALRNDHAGSLARAEQLRREAQEQTRLLAEATETLRRREEDLKNYPVPAYMGALHGPPHINVAISGSSGVGKSSLVNRLRRLKKGDPGYAAIGEVETTQKPELYEFPSARTGMMERVMRAREKVSAAWSDWLAGIDKPQLEVQEHGHVVGDCVVLENEEQEVEVVRVKRGKVTVQRPDGSRLSVQPEKLHGRIARVNVWDLPGAGTPSFPAETYISRMGIRHFDVVVLVTACRFTEAESNIVREMKEWGVPYILVRNKIDEAIFSAQAEDEENEVPEEVIIGNIKAKFASDNLGQVYTISSQPRCQTKYDFPMLEEDILQKIKQQRSGGAAPSGSHQADEAVPEPSTEEGEGSSTSEEQDHMATGAEAADDAMEGAEAAVSIVSEDTRDEAMPDADTGAADEEDVWIKVQGNADE